MWFSAVALAFAVSSTWKFLNSIDYFMLQRFLIYKDEECVRVRSIGPSEDQSRFNNNSIILTDWAVLSYMPGEDRPGSMHVASGFSKSSTATSTKSFVENDLKFETLPIVGYPEGIDFHPHGIYIHKPDNTLYVVNHAFEKGGDRVDVFGISTAEDGDDDPENDVPNKLHFKYSITNDWMQKELNGLLNDLVVVEPNKFYVTKYRPETEDRSEDGFMSLQTRTALYGLKAMILKPKKTSVLYCEFENEKLECRTVAEQFSMANGIAHNPDYSKIFVADSLDRTITIFDRDPSTNDLNGRTEVDLPNQIDNISFDEASGIVYGGSVTNVYATLKDYSLYQGKKETETSTSGVMEFSQQANGGWKGKIVLSTSKINYCTNAVRMGSHYVMGAGAAPFEGVLVCPVVEVDKPVDKKPRKAGLSELYTREL
jgi:hypothetical protein